MLPLNFTTSRTARYLSLGEPGAAITQVWVCLHGHGQPLAGLAAHLQNLDTPERLLLLARGGRRGPVQDLLTVGLSAQQRLVDATDPLPLAALAGP